MFQRFAAAAALFLLATAGPAFGQAFDRQGWLSDLDQLRDGMSASYANLEWAAGGRGMDLAATYGLARKRIEAAGDDAQARRAIERFLATFADGHLEVSWPAPAAAGAAAPAADAPQPLCDRLGYFDVGDRGATATRLPGFVRLGSPEARHITAGVAEVQGKRLGVLRIPIFEPQGFPDLCTQVAAQMKLTPQSPCDGPCQDDFGARADALMMAEAQAQVRAVIAAEPDVLLVDVVDNGGGNDSALAIARMLSGRPLPAARMGFVRGRGWAEGFDQRLKDIDDGLKTAKAEDRALLLRLRPLLEEARRQALEPCDRAPLWQDQPIACSGVVTKPLYATGLMPDAPSGAFAGKPWGEMVSSTSRYAAPYGLWRGPLVVLVDDNSASATELLAAMLQDAKAALIVGSPTFGAGCGHALDNRGPLTLSHSKGAVSMPDCVRLRADGSNEVDGVQPDLLIGFRPKDTPQLRLKRFEAALPAVMAAATAPH